MISFKVFFEKDDSLAVALKSSNSLSDFMRTLSGKSIKEILDSASFIRMYQANKYAGLGQHRENEHLVGRFIDIVTNFVNRGIKDARAMRGAIWSDEFKAKHNYDEYKALDDARKVAIRKFFHAKRDAGAPEGSPEYDKLRDNLDAERKEISHKISQNEFYQAWQKREKEIDGWVKDFHRTPLSDEDVAPDGSKEWKAVEQAWNAMFPDTQSDRREEEPEAIDV
ncbi:hypothetical protein H8E06_00355 [bacterium]|nr:hypothetical protein [bacterium]